MLHDQMGPLPRPMLPAKRAAPYVAPSLPQLIRIVESSGFRLELWRDTTAAVLEFFHDRRQLAASFNLSSISGPDEQQARQGLAILAGYIETLESPAGRTGISSLAGDSRQKLITRSYSACAVAASTGVPKLLFLPSKSFSVTPRARPQRPQTDIRTCWA
ncbi:MAG: hypothetical protein ABIQ73_10640 [Acidimicrobiales bacterium]